MSDESLELDELELDPPKKAGRLVAVVAAVVAATGGAFAGIQFLGPTVGSMLASEPGAESGDDGHGATVDSHGDPIAPVAQIHMIDNLVVNPAGAGTRFLIASIALAPGERSSVEELAARDIEVRDVLLRLLGSKTVDELSNIEERDALAQEMIDRLSAKLGTGVVSRIYMPQFFIQ